MQGWHPDTVIAFLPRLWGFQLEHLVGLVGVKQDAGLGEPDWFSRAALKFLEVGKVNKAVLVTHGKEGEMYWKNKGRVRKQAVQKCWYWLFRTHTHTFHALAGVTIIQCGLYTMLVQQLFLDIEVWWCYSTTIFAVGIFSEMSLLDLGFKQAVSHIAEQHTWDFHCVQTKRKKKSPVPLYRLTH